MSYPSTPQPDDPTISRRRAEAIKPFVDAALDLQRYGVLRDDWFLGGFSCEEWTELVEAFKPGR